MALSADAARVEFVSVGEWALNEPVPPGDCWVEPRADGYWLEVRRDDSAAGDFQALAPDGPVAPPGDSVPGGCWVAPQAAQRCEQAARRAYPSRLSADDFPAVSVARPLRVDRGARRVASPPLLADVLSLPSPVFPEALP